MKKRIRGPVFAVVLCLLFASAASARDFPSGTFTVEDPSGSVWEVSFEAEGHRYRVLRDGTLGVVGTYEATGYTIELRDREGPLAEPGKVGIYTWELSDGSLTFTKVSDAAEGRSYALTVGPWVMKELAEKESGSQR